MEDATPTLHSATDHDFGDGRGSVPAHQHENGSGWVEESATVAASAYVGPSAGVFGRAQVLERASVTETAWVCGNARVSGDAHVGGDAVVEGDAQVGGSAEVLDSAYVGGDIVLSGTNRVDGDTQIDERHGVPVPAWTSSPEEPSGADDSAVGRMKFGWPGALTVNNPVLRRLQGWELLLVLGIFPLGSACQAVVDLLQRIQFQATVTSHNIPALQGPWLVVSLTIVEQIGYLAAAGMVCYLLSRSGEGVRSINLGSTRLRMDLALLLPVFVVVQWIPQSFGLHMVTWLHLQGFYLISSPVQLPLAALTVAQLGLSITAGILEEIIVLGYLVRRLEQRGFNAGAVVMIDVAVRVSYHLYYGWNAIPIACWALASVLVYRRVRRLLPFILCHIAWDAAIPLRTFYPTLYHSLWTITLIATLTCFAVWGRWRPAADARIR